MSTVTDEFAVLNHNYTFEIEFSVNIVRNFSVVDAV